MSDTRRRDSLSELCPRTYKTAQQAIARLRMLEAKQDIREALQPPQEAPRGR